MLERGSHVRPADFTENEADAALEALRGRRAHPLDRLPLPVAQGMCVGGSTVVNNAVCFDLPKHVLERWNDPDGLNAGLDAAAAVEGVPLACATS